MQRMNKYFSCTHLRSHNDIYYLVLCRWTSPVAQWRLAASLSACTIPRHTPGTRTPKLTSIESVMPSSHLILCRPLFLLPPIPPSIRVFSNESTLPMRWPK